MKRLTIKLGVNNCQKFVNIIYGRPLWSSVLRIHNLSANLTEEDTFAMKK